VQAADEPDVAVERHERAGAILLELDVAAADVAAPRIVGGQLDVVDDVGVFALRAGDGGRDLLAPARRGDV
jgi:hypothetical protein